MIWFRSIRQLSLGLLVVLFLSTVGSAMAQGEGVPAEALGHATAQASSGFSDRSAFVIGIALTMGMACLAAGYAVAKVGAAALGAAAEKPELMGKALLFVGLAEGIAIYGLIVALFLIQKI